MVVQVPAVAAPGSPRQTLGHHYPNYMVTAVNYPFMALDSTGQDSVFTQLNERGSSFIRKFRDSTIGRYLLLMPTALMILLFMLLPSAILIYYSLGASEAVTLTHWERALFDPLYQSITFRTLRIAVITTVIDFMLGFPLAYAAVREGGALGKVIVIATLAPLTIDLVVRSFGWFILLSGNGFVVTALTQLGLVSAENPPQLLFNETGIIIGMSHVMLPFMVFPIINVLHTISPSLEHAARNLGANRFTVFRKILLPLAAPGIAAGVLITFVGTMAAYVTPAILGGSVKVLPISIADMYTGTSNWNFASALAIEIAIISLLVMVGYTYAMKRASKVGGI